MPPAYRGGGPSSAVPFLGDWWYLVVRLLPRWQSQPCVDWMPSQGLESSVQTPARLPPEWNMIYNVSQYPAIETRAGHRGRFRDPPLWHRFAFSSIIQFLSFIFIEFCRPLEWDGDLVYTSWGQVSASAHVHKLVDTFPLLAPYVGSDNSLSLLSFGKEIENCGNTSRYFDCCLLLWGHNSYK